jgi:hypothetical protein
MVKVEYNEHHLTVIPYMQLGGGKECPNSLVESHVCGVSVIVSSVSRFAYFVDEHRCGVVSNPSPAELLTAIETGLNQYGQVTKKAAAIARNYFSNTKFLTRMEQIYQVHQELLQQG